MKFKRLFFLLLIATAIPATIYGLKLVLELRKSAAGIIANIVIDTASPGGKINQSLWQNFSQGGEETKNMIAPVAEYIKALNPKIIRIDHLFDHHIKINGDEYDFSQLDNIVKSILSTGAVPMFSLSYMPPAFSEDGQTTSPPADWNQWRKLVAATVNRYSGRQGFNINNVYYEVWNEPDLFGKWHYGKEPNYTTLYFHTVSAAQSVPNTNSFKIGGPATTGFYQNWLKALLEFCQKNKVRIDFVSWHRYTKNLEEYGQDFEKLNQIINNYPEYFLLERLITEYGPDSENSAWNDNKLGAIHTIAGITKLLGKVHRVFAFEIKDGPDPNGQKYWGRWGILTHENSGISPKPRYYAYQFLNNFSGNRLPLSGEGSWVTAIAAKENNKIKVLIVNYDSREKHIEAPTITWQNLEPGIYNYQLTYFMGKNTTTHESITSNTLVKKIILETNSAAIIELSKLP